MRDISTLAVISNKGGAGKTTVSVNLALAGHVRGLRTLVADADPQRSSVDCLRQRLRLGPKVIETSGAKLFQLRITAEREGYELMVIDTPAGSEAEMVAAINAADLCVMVVRPNFLDVVAAVRAAEMVRRIGGRGMVVINQAPSARQGREAPSVLEAADDLRKAGLRLAPTGLRSRTAFQGCIARGLSAEEWAPGTPAAHEISRLWDHLSKLMEQLATTVALVRPYPAGLPFASQVLS